MTTNIANAITAYAQAARATAGAPPHAPAAGGGFADLVLGALKDTAAATANGEAVSLQAIANKADINEVVTAVTNAEIALQTVVAVRDRVIQAYNDIVKMPI